MLKEPRDLVEFGDFKKPATIWRNDVLKNKNDLIARRV